MSVLMRHGNSGPDIVSYLVCQRKWPGSARDMETETVEEQ